MAPSLVTLACRTEALQQAADSAVGRAIDLDSLKSATAGSPLELSMSATTRTQLAALYASSISPMGPLAMGQMAAALPFMGGAMPQPLAGQPAAPPPGWAPQQPPGRRLLPSRLIRRPATQARLIDRRHRTTQHPLRPLPRVPRQQDWRHRRHRRPPVRCTLPRARRRLPCRPLACLCPGNRRWFALPMSWR